MKKILIYALTEGRGGVEEYVMNFSRFGEHPSSKYGYMVLGDGTVYEEELNHFHVDYFFVPKKRKLFSNIYVLKKIMKEQRDDYETIYFNTSGLYYPVPYLLAKKYKYKIILHAHLSDGEWFKKIIHQINQIWINKMVNVRLACSTQAGKWMFGRNEDFQVIPNAIDIERFRYNDEYRKQYKKQHGLQEKFIIGNVGRLHKIKNQQFIIDILKELVEIGLDSVLLLVGDGDMKIQLIKKAEAYKIKDRVIFTGQTNEPEWYYSVMDYFVMPSFVEGFPITLVEAQANGVPCIVSDAITTEANISKKICYMSLSESPRKWANFIMKNHERYNCEDVLMKKGFDIKNFEAFIAKYLEFQ